MKLPADLGLLARQLSAHRAFVLRRAGAEAAARGLARLDAAVPGAARLAVRLHPRSVAAHRAVATRARRRGRRDEARRHSELAERLDRNTFELSMWETLRSALRRRAAAASASALDAAGPAALASAGLEAALSRLDAIALPVGARVDALLELARAAERAGDAEQRLTLLERAVDADAGRADALRECARASLEDGRDEPAAELLARATAIDPSDAETLALLGHARLPADPEGAQQAWWRALERAPRRDDLVIALERLAAGSERPAGEAARLEIVAARRAPLAVGESMEIELCVEAASESGLYLLGPFGGGLRCEPVGRIAIEKAGEVQRLPLVVRAQRPDRVNGGAPWELEIALCDGTRVLRRSVRIAVPDASPGRIHYVVTEDHELYDEREHTSAADARTTLVDKSRLAERIANDAGARWTHMVDVGSLALVDWAAERSGNDAWQRVARECREHLIEAVERGNDLGLHCHAFHDPDSAAFCHHLDETGRHIATEPAFLALPAGQRAFWSRAFPKLGRVDATGTRAWATWRGVGRLEALGRLGDPRFRVALFRAGGFDFGEDAAERARSLALLARLGIPADSDVPRPRLLQPPERTAYAVAGDPRVPEPRPERARLLEIRAELNVEGDFLADRKVLDAYVDRRLDALREPGGRVTPGVHVLCAMSHDKFINWRRDQRWDSLDPEYGDWAAIREHLGHVAARTSDVPELCFSRARDAVLDWLDDASPTLIAWRDEEMVTLSEPGSDVECFRYGIRLLGRGVDCSEARPARVAVPLPAWCFSEIRDGWIERDGERWGSHRPTGEPLLWFAVDSRAARWELVVQRDAGHGIEARPEAPGVLTLRSAHDYRRASIEVPAALSPDGARRRVRGVRLEPAPDARGFVGFLDPARLDGDAARGWDAAEQNGWDAAAQSDEGRRV